MERNLLKTILMLDQTVFSFSELLLHCNRVDRNQLKASLYYFCKKGDLYHIKRGFYAKSADYDKLELAAKMYKPSYIGFETVLASAGVVFQYYSQLFIASYQSREVLCDGQVYVFKSLKEEILLNDGGIEVRPHYSIASAERAFLDVVYLNKEYHFDNLAPLDWDKVYALLSLYQNESMEKRVARYYQDFKENN